MKRISVMTCLALLLTLSFSSAAFASSKKDIVDTAVAAGDFKTLGCSPAGCWLSGYAQGSWSVYRLRAYR